MIGWYNFNDWPLLRRKSIFDWIGEMRVTTGISPWGRKKEHGVVQSPILNCKSNFIAILGGAIHLEAWNLGDTIREDNSSSSQDRAKAMIFIRRNLDKGLKSEYLTDEDLLALWNALRNRYNHQTTVILPRARYEWTHLRIQDLKKGKNHSGQSHNQVPRQNLGLSFKNGNRHKGKARMNNAPRNSDRACHRCDGDGAHTCCTPKHLMDLYQASLKEKGVETNFLDQARPMDILNPVYDLSGQLNTTHLDVSDFIMERGNEVYRSD
ncbi:unnamed protein product [Malus baccata var. baccata]